MIVWPSLIYNGALVKYRAGVRFWRRSRFPPYSLIRVPARTIFDKKEKEMLDQIQDNKNKPILNEAQHIINLEIEREVKLKINYMKGMDLIHNEDVNGVLYKYDLPIVNTPIQFRNQLMVIDEEKDTKTPVMNLYEKLDIDKDASYEQYVIKVNQEFNHEIDMYGDIKKAGS